MLQNDIKAVTDVKDKTIHSASFTSIKPDETSDIQCKSQLSTVLYYIHINKTCEIFVGFTDVSAGPNF